MYLNGNEVHFLTRANRGEIAIQSMTLLITRVATDQHYDGGNDADDNDANDSENDYRLYHYYDGDYNHGYDYVDNYYGDNDDNKDANNYC